MKEVNTDIKKQEIGRNALRICRLLCLRRELLGVCGLKI